MAKEPFTVAIPDETLRDLKERLKRTRFAADFANDGWQYGTNLDYLKRLVEYWIDGYDWRRAEREINSFHHYTTRIEGIPIHFIHEPGKGPRPIPIIMSHGWPWTFYDFHKVIRPLADPAAFGGDPADAFDVVVPSLPGYGFSTPLTTTGINYWRTADLWVALMRDVLGYKKFAAQGGDWGALVSAQLGHKYAELLYGVHIHLLVPLTAFLGGMPDRSLYGPGEEGWHERTMKFFGDGSGYSAIQLTRPQTIAFALNDSPAGLCSWMRREAPRVERLRRRRREPLHPRRVAHHDDALLGDSELRDLGALLLRGDSQSVEALARSTSSSRGADRRRGIPQGDHHDAAALGRGVTTISNAGRCLTRAVTLPRWKSPLSWSRISARFPSAALDARVCS